MRTRNEMEAQDQQGDSLPPPEVIAVLLDLARLAHRVELAAPEAPGTIAMLLLERLVMLCKAQRGAVLFNPQRPVEHKPSFGASAMEVKDTPQARLQTPDLGSEFPPAGWRSSAGYH